MLALLVTISGFAKESKDIIIRDARKTPLTINNVKEGNLLTIKDTYGIILYKELIASNGRYQKGFDLTELPNGAYVFELEKDLEIKTIPFTVEENVVSFNKEFESTYFKPFVKQENNLIYVSKLNLSEEDTTINVYSKSNGIYTLSHTEKIENAKVIEKAYKIKKGTYKIEIASKNEELFTTYINN